MRIQFTKHALAKFSVLRRRGVIVTRTQVVDTIAKPVLVDRDRLLLLIAQSNFDRMRVLRVVYRIEQNVILVITFYPGKKSQYEK
jgi:hypothetical protein